MLISFEHNFIYLSAAYRLGLPTERLFESAILPDDRVPALNTGEVMLDSVIVGSRNYPCPRRRYVQSGYHHTQSAGSAKAMLGRDEFWDGATKFAVLQNPYALVVGWLHGWLSQTETRRLEKLDFFKTRELFKDWLLIAPRLPKLNEATFIDGKICLDRIIRHEHLTDDCQSMCRDLSLSYIPEKLTETDFPQPPRDWRDYYDAQTVAIIRDAYDPIFDVGNYSRDI